MGQKTPDQLLTLDRNTISNDDLLVVFDVSTLQLKTIKRSELTLGGGGAVIRWGQIVLDSVGGEVTFSEPFTALTYTVTPVGEKSGAPVTITLGTTTLGTKTLTSIWMYPAEDGTTINYIAVGV